MQNPFYSSSLCVLLEGNLQHSAAHCNTPQHSPAPCLYAKNWEKIMFFVFGMMCLCVSCLWIIFLFVCTSACARVHGWKRGRRENFLCQWLCIFSVSNFVSVIVSVFVLMSVTIAVSVSVTHHTLSLNCDCVLDFHSTEHSYMYMYTHICVFIFILMYMYACICIYIYTYTYLYIY